MMRNMEPVRRKLAAARKAGPQGWQPFTLQECAWDTWVLAFDPSLSKTGWCYLSVRQAEEGPRLMVAARGTLRQATDEVGFRSSWEKASQLRAAMQEQLPGALETADYIVMEMPAVKGWRTESSLMAGREVYELAGGRERGRPVSARHARKVLTGSASSDKRDVKFALARYHPPVLKRSWNYDERDALALGLVFLYDLEQAKAGT